MNHSEKAAELEEILAWRVAIRKEDHFDIIGEVVHETFRDCGGVDINALRTEKEPPSRVSVEHRPTREREVEKQVFESKRLTDPGILIDYSMRSPHLGLIIKMGVVFVVFFKKTPELHHEGRASCCGDRVGV